MSNILKGLKFAAVLVAISFIFSGCSGIEMSAEDLIKPPKPSGEMYYIETALEEEIGTGHTLKYPTSGEHRSAYILCDLMDTGTEDFVLAFYSTVNSENISTMHLNLLKKVDGEWLSLSDVSTPGIGVEKVEMIDFDKDGVTEIVVGWNVYGGVDKKIVVYELSGINLVPVIDEPYTDFIACDLDLNGKDGLFLLYHDISQSSAYVSVFNFTNGGVVEAGKCQIDGMVTSFSTPVASKLTNGRPAIFVDAVKDNGLQTEIIYLNNGVLVAPTYTPSQAISKTYRETSVASADIDGDGALDVPLTERVDVEKIMVDINTLDTITRWCGFDGTNFVLTTRAVMNYTDGYYFVLPTDWGNNVIVTRDTEQRQRVFSLWDTETGALQGELFRLRTVDESKWNITNNGLVGYEEIARSGGNVYIALVGSYDGPFSITAEEIKNQFRVS